MENASLRSSTLSSVVTASGVTLGRRNAMNSDIAGSGSGSRGCCEAMGWWQPVRACSLSQWCSTFAFMPWLAANAAMEVPGCWQTATSSALKAGVKVSGGYVGPCISRCLSL